MHPPGLKPYAEGQLASQEQLPRSDSPQQSPIPWQSRVPLDLFDPVDVKKFQLTFTLHRDESTFDIEAKADDPIKCSGILLPSTASTPIGDDDFDFETLLKDLVRSSSEDGIQARQLGVMFKDLRVIGIGARASFQPTVGSSVSPKGIARSMHSMRYPPLRDILSGFEGVVIPGEMLLVLGRPGSGCSTLLKIIANQRSEYHGVHGDVHYDSFTPEDIAKRYRGDVIYCPEDDVHFPTLTVEQTLTFAATMRAPQKRLTNQSREEYTKLMAEVLMRVFGLHHARNTVVGNAAIRGISGGEKKRVSIAEALSCRSRINAWDNSTCGLDASTALEFVRALRIGTDIARMTTVVSLYQAGEQLYNLFDKVCVINEGKMAYFGPAKDARQYFINIGYEPQNRQTTADFLVAVTDPNARKIRPGYEGTVPHTADEMAVYFKKSRLGQLNRSSMDSYFSRYVNKARLKNVYDASAVSEYSRHASKNRAYTTSVSMQVRAVMRRRWQILNGDRVTQAVQFGVNIFQAIMIGTVFLQIPDTTGVYFSRGGVLFFSLFYSSVLAMAELSALFYQRPIILRHQKRAMYYPFIDSLAHTIVDIPITLITSTSSTILTYFLVGLQKSTAQFFTFLLFIFVITLTMKAFFRGVAASFKTDSAAVSLAGFSVLVLTLYTGYAIPRLSIVGGLRWISYLNPLRYAFESLQLNEFHTLNGTCTTLVPQGPGYENITAANQVCTTVGSRPGVTTVDGNSFIYVSYGHEYGNLWMNFGIVCAFGAGFLAFLLTMTEFNTASAFDRTVTLFKQGSRAEVIADRNLGPVDEEKVTGGEAAGSRNATTATNGASEKPLLEGSTTANIFSWKHVQYVVPLAGSGTRKLLDDVSGYVAPGKLTALMGESGAGKTMLLNVLAQRVSTGVVLGDRLVNGQALPADFQAQTGYCQQMDTHIPESTVREALLFSAKLRQPESVPIAEKEAYVDRCLKMCGLEAHADAIVGSLGVEFKKRTTIGVELAAKPKLLLFLDEPTSGLDSQSAWAIVTCLRQLANNGQAILCTIHQPSAELFQAFDRLLLLRKGGQTVYFGDIGEKSSILLEYFERNGAPHCDPDTNPAEYMLDVIGAGATATSSNDWHQIWKVSREASKLDLEIENIHMEGRALSPLASGLEKHTEFATSWAHQLVVLTQRGFVSYWRNPMYILAKLILGISVGLLVGFTCFQAKNTLQGTQNKVFALFVGMVLGVPLAQQLQSVFINVRTVYEVRERPSRMYSWTALTTSQILIEIPWNILTSSLFFFCWYWTVGYETSRAGFSYLMYAVVFPLYYTTTGQAAAAMAPTAIIASVLFTTLFSFVILFNGVLQPFSQLGWWRWMYRISPFTYMVSGFLSQVISHQPIICSSTELVILQPPSGVTCGAYMGPYFSYAGGYVMNPQATSACAFCPFETTDQYMMLSLNIEYSHHWRDLGILLGIVLFNVFAIFALTYLFRIRTGSPLEFIKRRFTRA
ncbi:pleiotropic drug resistance ABC transporter [Gyrodon lividus]|nr:pleiotropic drug resistance ABC transporter [Gyrodon lividus]